jgi:hypothetical protein
VKRLADEAQLFCPACKSRGKIVPMVRQHDMIRCEECKTGFQIEGISPLERYQQMWEENAEWIYPYLRPEISQSSMANTRLFFLYEDCQFNMLIGRYNAAIILIGVLLEALMKELIYLKTGKEYKKNATGCLSIIKDKGLMEFEDMGFIREFTDKVRNYYQHSNEDEIVKDRYIWIWPIQFKGELTWDKLQKAHEKTKSGEIKPTLIPVSWVPNIRSVVKQQYDKKLALELYNQVSDFLLLALNSSEKSSACVAG